MAWSTPSTVATLITSGSTLTNGSRIASSVITGNTAEYATFELNATFATAPAADSPVYLYLLSSVDGSTVEDGSSTITPSKSPAAVFTVRAINTAQKVSREMVMLPPGRYQALLVNAAGQTMSASYTLKYITYNAVA